MIVFDAVHQAVHYPNDRRFRIWISSPTLWLLVCLVVVPLVLAWLEHAIFGLPYIAPSSASAEGAPSGPHGFPFWIRWSHFSNLFFLFMLIRSGLSILMDHPRLYWNDNRTPGTEWIRFTPLEVPTDRIWTAKDDARYIMAPLAILTGMAMSPALVNRFPWYAKLFGGRQAARSIHFLDLVGFLAFIVVHVTLVAMTGFERNMNHIVLGTDGSRPGGMILGLIGIALVVLSWVAAHYISWFFPRGLQLAQKAVTQPVKLVTLDRLIPCETYTAEQISPHFWPNGKMPVREDWKQFAANDFKDYRLKVAGLVEHPAELSLDDLRALGLEETITMHHCIQGWSGIAQWSGVSMRKLIEHVRPMPSARVVAFYSFGGSLYGDLYYDTQTIYNAMKPECMAARRLWRGSAIARGESAWLQNGQVDRTD